MTKTLRLEDLYRTGKEATVHGPEGSVQVYLRKINPLEHESAFRRARARQAEILVYRRDPESEEYKAAYAEICDFGEEEGIIEYLISDDVFMARQRISEELGHEEDWAEDGYLQGLRDAWRDRLEALAKTLPTDPDVVRVRDELLRFDQAVDARALREAERLRDKHVGRDLEELRTEAVKHYLKTRAAGAFVREHQRCQIWYATRRIDDQSERYFDSREAVDLLEPVVLMQLIREYDGMSVDVQQGKDSRATPPSSPSSEQPDEEGTPASSGPVAVPA